MSDRVGANFRESPASPRRAAERPSAARPAFWVCAAVLFASAGALSTAIGALHWYTKKLPINVKLKCESIPTQTGSWTQVGRDELMSEAVEETLGTRNYVSRVFVERHPAKENAAPRAVQVHLAYYTGQVDTVPHVPERCFVAGGGSIVGGPWVVPVPLDRSGWAEDADASAEAGAALGLSGTKIYTSRMGPSSRSPGTRVHLPRGIEKLELRVSSFKEPGSDRLTYAGYFFIANGAITSSAQNVRLLAFDLKSDYAYYMKVQFSATRIEGPEELARIAGSMLDEILPDIMLCVPDWTDVIRGDFPADNPRRMRSGREPAGR